MGTIRVGGQDATDRLMENVKYQHRTAARAGNIDIPTPAQVSIVLHALADHTAIMAMLAHRPDPTSPWPEATSVGRWLHDVGYELEEKKQTPPKPLHWPCRCYISIRPSVYCKDPSCKPTHRTEKSVSMRRPRPNPPTGV